LTVNTESLSDFGELSLIGKKKVSSLSISSFFPLKKYTFMTGELINPYTLCATIERWMFSGRPVRFRITDTTINMAFTIENFNYGVQDGTGDVYYDLELKEYRFITSTVQANSATAKNGQVQTRPVNKTVASTYTVKAGDSLWAIAKRLYGDGAKYKTIASKNGIKSPYIIRAGQVLKV
jgi:nucleoid-associated protein YgaU